MSLEIANRVKQLCDVGRFEDAWDLAEKSLYQSPHNFNALNLCAFMCWKLRKFPLAYHLGLRATQLAPHNPDAWLNVGLSAHELWLTEESEEAYKTTLRLAQNDGDKSRGHLNLSALYIDTGRWAEAEEHARKAFSLNPKSEKAKANIGFGLLGQGKWEGWNYYSCSLGLESRQKMKFNEEPDWDGTPGKVVAFHGEQGIGDELSFASMLPDAIRDSKKVIIDCEKKLEGLFRRSFPKAKVYGTRKAKASDGIQWDKDDWKLDASLALGELGKFYRRTDESFTGEPYLVSDPIRRSMWRRLFDVKMKPCIGIAWTGGIERTGERFRTLTLEKLLPILRSVNAHWVSLQYKDCEKEIREFKKLHPEIDIVQYPWATLTQDYDDTAALVSELDMVICMQTAVAHLAGALGKECWVMLPQHSQWRYGMTGERMRWYKSLRVFRQKERMKWDSVIGHITGELKSKYGLYEERAA